MGNWVFLLFACEGKGGRCLYWVWFRVGDQPVAPTGIMTCGLGKGWFETSPYQKGGLVWLHSG